MIANFVGVEQLNELWLPLIIVIEALLMLPMCRVLNFQKFKILTIPILITIAMMFVCLIGNLIIRVTDHLESDFC